jgi:hypothetical protein
MRKREHETKGRSETLAHMRYWDIEKFKKTTCEVTPGLFIRVPA